MDVAEIERRIAGLSDKHLQVLERVASYKSSKVIGRELDISPYTVDQRVGKITEALGVQSRIEAAQLYQVARGSPIDGSDISGRLVYKPSDLSFPGKASDGSPRLGERDPSGIGDIPVNPLFSVLMSAGKENRLSVTSRFIAIVLIMLFSTLLIAATVSLAEGLSRVF